MSELFKSPISFLRQKRVDQTVRNYLDKNNLTTLIQEADRLSNSTGCNLSDYVVLHSYVRANKPKYILECGTGKSTWIIADALKKNAEEARGSKPGIVVSMEEDKSWFEHASKILPDHLKSYIQLQYSPITTFTYSFLMGTCYKELPEYPYDLVYIDGPDTSLRAFGDFPKSPDCKNDRGDVVANMDFIKVVLNSTKQVTGIVDYRRRTQIAYVCAFGKNKLRYMEYWSGLGIIENVSRSDLVLNGSAKDYEARVRELLVRDRGNPSWI